MVLSSALLSPLHRFPVLWCSYRPLLRAARTAPLDAHHRLAIEQYIKRELRQWRSLRTALKVQPKLREAEEFIHRLESTAHSSAHLERMRELADHLILRHAKKPTHVVKPRQVPKPAPSIIRATAFNPPMQREWRGWIRKAQKQEQREYKRKDMRISPELYATVRGLRRSIARNKSAAGQARRREAQLPAE
ncbi:hypothetical protein AAT19DRAFT_11182 [Rhodotorula toruloides]|uniref:Uncharacterized protein n=1 Tax=Rhodotorula toruloides TaxID=5286 RepID=A0A2S9ZXI0_RHOTO|nr:hypothetical protein AAT19DRAFT_11182 [Rhodotorula toruloides]